MRRSARFQKGGSRPTRRSSSALFQELPPPSRPKVAGRKSERPGNPSGLKAGPPPDIVISDDCDPTEHSKEAPTARESPVSLLQESGTYASTTAEHDVQRSNQQHRPIEMEATLTIQDTVLKNDTNSSIGNEQMKADNVKLPHHQATEQIALNESEDLAVENPTKPSNECKHMNTDNDTRQCQERTVLVPMNESENLAIDNSTKPPDESKHMSTDNDTRQSQERTELVPMNESENLAIDNSTKPSDESKHMSTDNDTRQSQERTELVPMNESENLAVDNSTKPSDESKHMSSDNDTRQSHERTELVPMNESEELAIDNSTKPSDESKHMSADNDTRQSHERTALVPMNESEELAIDNSTKPSDESKHMNTDNDTWQSHKPSVILPKQEDEDFSNRCCPEGEKVYVNNDNRICDNFSTAQDPPKRRITRHARLDEATIGTNKLPYFGKSDVWEHVLLFFLSRKDDECDEDEVSTRMQRLWKTAVEQVRNLQPSTDVDERAVLEACFQETLEEAVNNDILSLFQNQASGAESDRNAPPSLNRRSIGWVKKVLLLSQRRSTIPHLMRATRQTRGMVKTSQQGRIRQIDILHEAINDVQNDLQIRANKKKKLTHEVTSNIQAGADQNGRRRSDVYPRVEAFRKKSSNPSMNSSPKASDKAFISLNRIESQRKRILGKNRKDLSYRTRALTPLPPEYVKLGIEHRLPTWDSKGIGMNNKRKRKAQDDWVVDPNLVSRKRRLYLRCEYFYSSVDEAWYRQADFAGQPPVLDAKLIIGSNWKQFRKGKPRRFSPAFLHSQLKDRNRFRQSVRFLQSHSAVSLRQFPGVPGVISVGSTVAALNKRSQSIEEGLVIDFAAADSTYLVQFFSPQLHREYCPDCEVKLLKREAMVDRDPFFPRHDRTSLWTNGSALSILENQSTIGLSLATALKDLTIFCPSFAPSTLQQASQPLSLIERGAEREALLKLMTCIHKTLQRQDELLTGLEGFVSCYGSQDAKVRSSMVHVQCSRLWLQNEIQQTKEIADRMLRHLNLFYGSACDQPTNNISGLSRFDVAALLNRLLSLPVPATTVKAAQTMLRYSSIIGNQLAEAFSPRLDTGVLDYTNVFRSMHNHLGSSAQLLLATSFASNIAGPSLAKAIMDEMLTDSLFPEATMDIEHNLGDVLLLESLSARANAVSDLQESVRMLATEMALANFNI